MRLLGRYSKHGEGVSRGLEMDGYPLGWQSVARSFNRAMRAGFEHLESSAEWRQRLGCDRRGLIQSDAVAVVASCNRFEQVGSGGAPLNWKSMKTKDIRLP